MNRQDFDQMVDLVVALVVEMDAKMVEGLRDFAPQP